jgi:hypothetical protein
MQGEFAVKQYYDLILDHFSTELGRRGGVDDLEGWVPLH